MKYTKIVAIVVFGLMSLGQVWAVDASYYSSLNGKKDSELRSALTVLLYNHHTQFVKYDNWSFNGDYDNSGNLLDIYSSCGHTRSAEHTYKCCCDGINREHVICQSNFGGSGNKDKIPQYSDQHHLYPVDGRANGHRSDLPFGECSGGAHGTCNTASTVLPSEGTSTCSNHEFGKSGTSTFSVALPSGGGKVYEVGDEYKGDIARAVLYMVVRYAESQYCRLPDGAVYTDDNTNLPTSNAVSSNLTTANSYPVTAWANTTQDKVGQMFSSSLSTNYGLSDYGKAILLKWHRQDPVSQKEINRNDSIAKVQGNRNPFVDYPCLAEYMWGDRTGENFNTSNVVGSFESGFTGEGCSNSTDPMITLPTGTIAFGATNTSTPLAQTVKVHAANLTSGNLTLALSGTNAGMFSLSTTSISKANAESGQNITITYVPTAVGSHTATLSIYGCGIAQGSAHTVTLTGTCEVRHTVTWMDKGSQYHQNTVANNGRPDIPGAPDDCSTERVFMGWTAQSGYNNTTTAPADLFTTTAPQVTSDKTFYAVYATATTSGSSGDYVLYEDDLSEGNYVLYYGGKAMKAKISSNRFAYAEVTPSNNTITSPMDSIVWHVAQSGNYWTIYNEAVGEYAASNGTKNQGQLLADGTDDKSLWAVNDPSDYDFVNKYNLAQSVNSYLRNNGTYGFACYSSSTGGSLTLYKQAASVEYSQYSLYCSAAANVTITFHANGGTGTMPSQLVPENISTTLSANAFSRECYSWIGWATSEARANAGTVDYTTTITTSSNKDLYAVWSVNTTYTVNFKNNGVDYDSPQSGCEGQTITAVADPTACDGYTFEGWSTQQYAANNTGSPSIDYTGTIPGANTTYYAVYSKMEETTGESASLTKLGSSSTFSAGDKIVIVAKGTTYALYQETTNNTYVKNWTFENSAATVGANDKNYVTLTATDTNWYLGDATNGYLYTSGSNNLACPTDYKTAWTIAWNATESAFTIVGNNRYLSCRTDLSSSNANLYRLGGQTSGDPSGAAYFDIYKYVPAGGSTTTTYHTTAPDCCTATLTVESPDDTKGEAGIE